MAHPEAGALWSLAADELSAEDSARIRAHLSECPACAAQWEQIRTSRAMLHEARQVEPVVRWDAVGTALRAKVAASTEAKRTRWPWARTDATASSGAQRTRWPWVRTDATASSGAQRSRWPWARTDATASSGAQRSRRPWARTDAAASTGAQHARWPWALALAGACAVALALFLISISTTRGTPTSEVLAGKATTSDEALAGRTTVPAGTELVEQTRSTDEALAEQPGSTGSTTSSESAVESLAMDGNPARTDSVPGAVLKEQGGQERELRAGMRLRSGVAVKTPAKASAMLRLPDASQVRVSAGSEVELSKAEPSDVHLTVHQGRLSVKASHAERRGFRVDVAGLRVSVVGTVFTVERTALGASVAVSEGRVRVELEGQPARMVGAGERVELRSRDQALKQEKLSQPDREALEVFERPTESSTQDVGTTVPTAANPPARAQDVLPAVAHAPQAPSTVKSAVATAPVMKAQSKKLVVASLSPQRESPPAPELPDPVAVPPDTEDAPQAEPPATVATTQPPSSPLDPSQDFAPYPAPSVTERMTPPRAPATAPSQPTKVAEATPPKKDDHNPQALLSKDADERFLGYARLQLSQRSCENYLAGLEEIADKSPRKKHREQARYLRARCFEQRLQGQDAKLEYRQYLKEFPRGRYVREAGAAILP
ncbi:FecR domain-containing protein [Myxococcus sp. XM-1-1-1]|uniref:FecR domain-containing protein n=1 Tax=Myxococcus sp. XM-1-1-1 TaxID=2874602 RepID=UPI001CBBDF2B|nr:FecR domain-containing protein [Myxococcus sp. XM-1-1-1]MBZ4412947.1 FecR domain-containing protein [Myxococcus sp. XM-1-1-1]